MILLIIFVLSVIVNAQDSVYTLQPVEVTAGRSTLNNFQSHHLVNQDDIQKGETGLTLLESFYILPGIIVNDRNNPSMGDKISIRGIGARASFGIRGVKILMDNIPLTLPDGQSQTNNIELLSTGKIEILKGPASSLYGNASGGVINLTSQFPESKQISISPQIIFGGYKLRKYSLKLGGTSGKHSYLVSGMHTDFKGFREHSAQRTFLINSVYRNEVNDGIKLSAVVNYFNSPFLLNPSSLNKESAENNPSMAREYVKTQGASEKAYQLQTGVTLSYSTDPFMLETTLYYLTRDLLNPIPGRIIDLNRNTGGLRSTVKLNKNFFDYKVIITGGFDIEYQMDLRSEFINNGISELNIYPENIFSELQFGDKLLDQKEQVFSAGPFLSAELYLNEEFRILGALRYDNYLFSVSDYFSDNNGKKRMVQWSPAAGIIYKPDIFLNLFFNYSTSFQTPTAAELSNREDGSSGFNMLLKPEKINQFEFGLNYFSEVLKTTFSAAAYIIDFRDLLVSRQSTYSDEIYFMNAARAVNDGIEFYTETVFNDFSLRLGYTKMDFTFREHQINYNNNIYNLSGRYVPAIPGNIIAVSLGYSPEVFWLKGGLQWVDSYFVNDFNGPQPESSTPVDNFRNPSYLNVNARCGINYEFNFVRGNIFLGINNLLNKRFNASVVSNAAGDRYFEPAPGRNFYFGLGFEY